VSVCLSVCLSECLSTLLIAWAELVGSALQMECRSDSDCSWPTMAKCADDETNEGTKRCQCKEGYQQYDGKTNLPGEDRRLCGKTDICAFRCNHVDLAVAGWALFLPSDACGGRLLCSGPVSL